MSAPARDRWTPELVRARAGLWLLSLVAAGAVWLVGMAVDGASGLVVPALLAAIWCFYHHAEALGWLKGYRAGREADDA